MTDTMGTLLIYLLLVLYPIAVDMEIYSSINAIKVLVKNRDPLFDAARYYVNEDPAKLKEINSFIWDTNIWISEEREVAKSWSDDDYGFVEHPIAALHVISIWLRLQRIVGPDFKPPPGVQCPTQLDYTGAVAALVRLQRTYKLDTEELAAGRVDQTPAAHGLHPGDCYAMALSWMSSDHGAALSWFRQLSDADLEALDSRREYHSHLVQIYMKSESHVYNANQRAKIMETMRIMGDIGELRKHLMTGTDAQVQRTFWRKPRYFTREYYETLCRGDNITNTIFRNKDLMCVYKQGILPYIQYKEEIHSFSPRISLFHDVISDSQSEMMKGKANPGLHRAYVGEPAKYITSDERVSKLSWLSDEDAEVDRKSRQISEITGLDTAHRHLLSSAEHFQIVNYGLGGQYEPHYDFYEDPTMLLKLPGYILNTGDRISTFMYYLSTVKAGGATVFPEIGVRVPPIKNAAAFWYNIRLSGETDRQTLHAGCPVLLGQKWVGNKWIREAGQVFRRPCGLSSNDTDPICSR